MRERVGKWRRRVPIYTIDIRQYTWNYTWTKKATTSELLPPEQEEEIIHADLYPEIELEQWTRIVVEIRRAVARAHRAGNWTETWRRQTSTAPDRPRPRSARVPASGSPSSCSSCVARASGRSGPKRSPSAFALASRAAMQVELSRYGNPVILKWTHMLR